MNPALWFGNQHDQELIDFVAAQGGRGYSHHWISYKIAYLSDEQVILAGFLPYRAEKGWEIDNNRYEPYARAVAESDNRVFVTHRNPTLTGYLEQAFATANLTYQTKDIGPYRVYYNLSRIFTPQEMRFKPVLK